ncbi:choline/Carnitine o-acyltransferase domain-containing protein [Trichoderma breve]|uniref:Choline/Carnitine o-acyltransferase domain-containing protein n=1 Tax=Trichoderma breve TaxID=2034170 RepID=A0A9W9B6N2_9HYPO|nr:choline/Carnitine o-acyltransferase domain-containing protein [Trichoderma breve]KAJ4857543.1 choline/Carnitine o-acyltransferase domain-containing protein [Trichoderma breve]
MTASVRVFHPPQSIAERLAEPNYSYNTPRSLPDLPDSSKESEAARSQSQTPTPTPAQRQPPQLSAAYTRVPKATYHESMMEGGITFGAQDKLPKLPIPELENSARKYLEALKPLQSPREHAETKHAVSEFLREEGPDLQEKLKRYAQGKTSYIEQFWYDSYLNFDNPVVLNLNPFFLLADDPTPARNNQVTRAASLVVSSLEFIRAVRKEELPPDKIKGTPLCMYQFSRLFGTARVPTEAGCQIEQDPESKHIVVMCHGQIYWFDVLDDNSDVIMTEKDIELNLQTIVDDATQTPIQDAAKNALGVLSTENRKVWSGLRDILTREPGSNNADSLNIVDSALFVLCLDYIEPTNVADLCQNMLCGTSEVKNGVQIGTCTNRWYDKLQIIVCKNGSAGINFEHTGVDGHTVLRFASDVYTDTILRFARTINGQAPTLWTSTSPDPSKREIDSFGDVNTTPRKLGWDMIPELSIACLDFSTYGKHFITSMGFSPDAFVQMAFQAAYYGLYGRVECTYEPAMTKTFLHGRTEAIRPVTKESVDFVQTFWGDNPVEQKMEALKRACQKHVNNTRECSKAQGCDRHLYALFSVSRDHHPLPLIFADSGWDKLNTTILSTSNCGNPSLRHFGFGPTSGDGFGIGYIIKDDSISICVSSKHRQTKRFVDTLESYLLEVRRILRITNGKVVSTKGSKAREAELARPKPSNRLKSRGRLITGPDAVKSGGRRLSLVPGSPTETSFTSDDDELGGYGFFDAGMLFQALKARGNTMEEEHKASERAAGHAKRRDVGKKLRLVTE